MDPFLAQQIQPVVDQVLQAYQTDPYLLSADALLAYMCYAWEQKIRNAEEQIRQSPEFRQLAPQEKQLRMQQLNEDINAEHRDRNYTIALWRHFAQGVTPQERQRRLIDAITLEALTIEAEYQERLRGNNEPIIDRQRFFNSSGSGVPSVFDDTRSRIFQLQIHQVSEDGRVETMPWWNISPVISDPSFIFFDGLNISEEEWSRNWERLLEPDIINELENADICAEIWTSLVQPPRRPVTIEVYNALTRQQLIERQLPIEPTQTTTIMPAPGVVIEDVSPERRVTPPAKRAKIGEETGMYAGVRPSPPSAVPPPSPQQQQQEIAIERAFAQQSRAQPQPPMGLPPPARSVNEEFYGEPAQIEICSLCQEACVPEAIQLRLIEHYDAWVQYQQDRNEVSTNEHYVNVYQHNPEVLVNLLMERGQVASQDHAEQYVSAWLSTGFSNFVSNRGNPQEVMRYFNIRCADADTPHTMHLCQSCIRSTAAKRSTISTQQGTTENIVRALPLLETGAADLAMACPLNCRRDRSQPVAMIKELFPFDPATGTLFGEPIQCGEGNCYKPSNWDDDLIGPYSLYMENLCFFHSNYVESSDINLFVGIVKGYDTDHTSYVNSGGVLAPIETIADAQYPKRIVVEQVFPAPSKNAYGQDIVRYESVPVQDVFPITILPEIPQGAAVRRYNSLQQARDAAAERLRARQALPATNIQRQQADEVYRRLEQLMAETKSTLPDQIEKLTRLLAENQRIGGSSLLLKRRGIRPSISRESRQTACGICNGVLDQPELVRIYSQDQTVSNMCKIQLEENGTAYNIGVTEDYKYKTLTEDDKNHIRARVLYTFLGFHYPLQPNPDYQVEINSHFEQRNNAYINPGLTLARVILFGLNGIRYVLVHEQGLPEEEQLYTFIKDLWDQIFTSVRNNLAWPQPTKVFTEYDVLPDRFKFMPEQDRNLVKQALDWSKRFRTYDWQSPQLLTGNRYLIYADRVLSNYEKDEITRRKRKREDMAELATSTAATCPTSSLGRELGPFAPQAPSAGVGVPSAMGPFAPPPTRTQQQRPAYRATAQPPSPAIVPTTMSAVGQPPITTTEQLGLRVVPTTVPTPPRPIQTPSIPTQQIQPPSSERTSLALVSRPVVPGAAVSALPQQLVAQSAGPLVVPTPPRTTTAIVPAMRTTGVPTPAAGIVTVTGPREGARRGSRASLLLGSAGAAPVVAGLPTITAPTSQMLALPAPPVAPLSQQQQQLPPPSQMLALPAPPVSLQPTAGALVPAAAAAPQQRPQTVQALLPPLETVVPDWRNWAIQIAAMIGRPNNPEFQNYAVQWLQSQLDRVLQTGIQSNRWEEIAENVRNSIAQSFFGDLKLQRLI